MLLAIPALALLLWPSLWLVLGRPRRVPATGAVEPDTDATDAGISVIIPARDEEDAIGRLLDSLHAQSIRPGEVIVVDDGSTDRTAAIAREKSATVLSGQELPAGWRGKPWACFQGARAATAPWLLFLDADTELEPGAMRKLAALTSDGQRVYSVCPYHAMSKPYEQLSAFFNLCMAAGAGAFGVGEGGALFGQCLLVSKANYTKVGGHETVKDRVLENLYLAEAFFRQDIDRTCYLGQGTIRMRMYPEGLRSLWRGWSKGFLSGASATAGLPLALCSAWITGAMTAMLALVLLLAVDASPSYTLATLLVYCLYAGQCAWSFRLLGTYSVWTSILYPVALLFYQVLFFAALITGRRAGTLWKGRHVH
ncbi:glycosyltransferase [Ruficoccus amylovorans]|uniref:Glycosyltransferase n=1 Tax=Ruficoccus amylovorans TaxID=1804625 RepID=A0A842HDZ5_9BACT|nr:glycosyltransferase [Ruficoccus amylovorans]MBC2594459.1 glycosyltransferase [Ruficoccus amylovorans]